MLPFVIIIITEKIIVLLLVVSLNWYTLQDRPYFLFTHATNKVTSVDNHIFYEILILPPSTAIDKYINNTGFDKFLTGLKLVRDRFARHSLIG